MMFIGRFAAAVILFFSGVTAPARPVPMEVTPLTVATPHAWRPPPAKTVVVSYSGPCPAAVARIIQAAWGAEAGWAIPIAYRETRCEPWQSNPSGAKGLFELKLPLHNSDFLAVGCSPASWADASCNARAAFHLFQSQGTAPWRL